MRLSRMRDSLGLRLGEPQIRTLSPMRSVFFVMPSRSSCDVPPHSAAYVFGLPKLSCP